MRDQGSRLSLTELDSNFFAGQQGSLSYTPGAVLSGSATLYGSGYILQNSPNVLCPYYDQDYYTDGQGQTYYINCGMGSGSSGTYLAIADGANSGAIQPGEYSVAISKRYLKADG